MNNPTPYDDRIKEIESEMLEHGLPQAMLPERDHALDMRRAYRLGEQAEAQRHAEVSQAARDGVRLAEPDALDAVAKELEETTQRHPGQWRHSPKKTTCEVHPHGCPSPQHPGQRVLGRQIVCTVHPNGCDISGDIRLSDNPALKAELRMVKVDAPGFKGEHTGRAKLELHRTHFDGRAIHWADCPCVICVVRDAQRRGGP
ncbi:MAG: hypothetical protein V3S68_00725 [Dehalococcoidia bacterium]